VRGLTVQFLRAGQWVDIPSATVTTFTATALNTHGESAPSLPASLPALVP
jgi:hypothetical protein